MKESTDVLYSDFLVTFQRCCGRQVPNKKFMLHLPAVSIIFRGSILLWLALWRFGFEVVYQAPPNTLDAVYVPLTRLQVLVHFIHHLLRALQCLSLTDELLTGIDREKHIIKPG